MKKNRQIQVSVAKTINMGNYESVRIQTGLTQNISDKANADDEYEECFDECSKQLLVYENNYIRPPKKKKKKKK